MRQLLGAVVILVLEGSMTGEVLEAYVEQFVTRELTAGDVVVWDNLAAHKRPGVRRAIEAAGATLLFLPAYSPDLNPIELAWSKLKTALRGHAARTPEQLERAIANALAAITVRDIEHWLRHCGYHQCESKLL